MGQKKDNTFTKSIMSVVVLLYFVGAIIGTTLVIAAAFVDVKMGLQLDTAMFVAYAAYIGGPTATAIGFYAWKSKAENLLKIKQTHEEKVVSDNTEFIQALSQMDGG